MSRNNKVKPLPLSEYIKATKETKSIRFNEGKPKWSLIDFNAIEGMTKILEFGVEKYGKDNWKLGLDQKETLDSLMRHLVKLMDGEELDKESLCHHIHHIMVNAMFYAHFYLKENNKQNE